MPETLPPAEAHQLAANEAAAQNGEHPAMQRLGRAAMAALIAPGIIGAQAEQPEGQPTPVVAEVSAVPGSGSELAGSAALADQVENKYQREFQTDAEDSEASQNQVQQFIDANRDFFEHPEKIEKVLVTGLASAEDEKLTDESLQESSEDNEGLAGQRGMLAAKGVIDRVKAQFGVDISDKVQLGAREDMLSDQELQEVQELTVRFGYNNTREMIDRYNQLGDVPPEVSEYLDKVLAARRGATIEVVTKDQATQQAPNRAERRRQQRENKDETGAVDRYEAYLPDQAADVEEPGLPPLRRGELFRRVQKQSGTGATLQQGHRQIDPLKDPRRSSEFGRKGKGRPGYHAMNQSRRGRGR